MALNNYTQWSNLIAQLETCNPVLAQHLCEWQNAELADYVDYLWRARQENLHLLNNDPPKTIDSVFLHHCRSRNVVLSAHHTAIMSHPLAWQSLLVAQSGRKPPPLIPVLCTDWVPMDNLLYPRGLLLPAANGLRKFNLFPKSVKKKTVSQMPSFTQENLTQLEQQLQKAQRAGDLTDLALENYLQFVRDFMAQDEVLSQPGYPSQCSIINRRLCESVFPTQRFAFFNISEVISELLLLTLRNEFSLVSHILSDADICQRLIALLDDQPGCWSTRRGQGSILFWQIRDGKLCPLTRYQKHSLSNAHYTLRLERDALCTALLSGEIIPGMALVFSVLMFEYGLVCAGGMRQITYTTAIKSALTRIARQTMPEYLERVEHWPVELFVIGLFEHVDRRGRPMSFVDYLYPGDTLKSGIHHHKLREAIIGAADSLLKLSA